MAESVLETSDRIMAFAIDQLIIILVVLIGGAMLFGLALPDDVTWPAAAGWIVVAGGGLTGVSAFAIREERPITPGAAIALLPHRQ